MNRIAVKPDHNVRALSSDDLESIIRIDTGHVGEPRRRFFEKRLAHARQHPDEYLHVGVSRDDRLIGFVFARILRGEFGRAQSVAMLDAGGVEHESREQGVGQTLMQGLVELMRERAVQSLQSQADWTSHGLLRFFDSSGFTLAPRLVLERSVLAPLAEPSEEE